ncbi:beta/alpha barrel domain-containing protein [Athalassotoga saccharophila]|uniref:aldolase n=1 Tax=Athalassotoga saccharophila TaxID=1441386 RepID=UPI00137A5820|nr:aldolase [Athalassotoga saccharophila]BBJ27597.1 fructose-bisphosphate aldolase class 1 [Athalassotoga saccharophila]
MEKIPLDVPKDKRAEYSRNYEEITHGVGRLMLFAGDQKVEHLNKDFFGKGIAPDDADPEHLFRIASKAKIGVFATQLGLISRYGMDYREVPYLVKLNSKTNLIKADQMDPFSNQWIDVDQVVKFKKESGLKILGVGYTIYPGSKYEAEMFRQAAQIVYKAHENGLVTVIWAYPRGISIADELDPHLIAGATGIVAALGSDFVKVNYPEVKEGNVAEMFKEAVMAAGRTKVLCAGGPSIDVRAFLQRLHDQIFISGAAGNATGRNIHQKPLDEAIRMCNAIYDITVEGKSVDEAMKAFNQ